MIDPYTKEELPDKSIKLQPIPEVDPYSAEETRLCGEESIFFFPGISDNNARQRSVRGRQKRTG
jgi:hypothetical protein